MPLGHMLKEVLLLADEMHLPIAIPTVATIWGGGGVMPTPELRTC